MKRTVALLSLSLILTAAALAQTSQPQQAPEKLTKQQVQALIATAQTPADHARIAQYYENKAADLLAQSRQHEQIAAQFKSNPATNSAKNSTGTVSHCEYLAERFRQQAAAMQTLAQQHQRMAAVASGN
jgi:hypothetical protein